jgi:hypothetical protein
LFPFPFLESFLKFKPTFLSSSILRAFIHLGWEFTFQWPIITPDNSMSLCVSFTVQCPWQKPALLTAYADDPLSAVLKNAGYGPLNHHLLLVAVEGGFINPEFTVSRCGIHPGSRVILLQRRIQNRSPRPQQIACRREAVDGVKIIARLTGEVSADGGDCVAKVARESSEIPLPITPDPGCESAAKLSHTDCL